MTPRTKSSSRSMAVIRPDSLHRADVAATLLKQSIKDFISDAADEKAAPILKKHLKSSADLVPAGDK